jgi:serine/threonine-protein kinase
LTSLLGAALARAGFFGQRAGLSRARVLAEKAVQIAPSSGDAWLALAYAQLYSGSKPEATTALLRAVTVVPGFAVAQHLLGEQLLEAADFDHAVPHLEAAVALDASSLHLATLARAYVYVDRFDDGIAEINKHPVTLLGELSIGRYHSWRGERYEQRPASAAGVRNELQLFCDILRRYHATGTLSAAEVDQLEGTVPEHRPSFVGLVQLVIECLADVGAHDRALHLLELAVNAGIHDTCWMDRCAILAPLRGRAEFRAMAELVRWRAQAVREAIL